MRLLNGSLGMNFQIFRVTNYPMGKKFASIRPIVSGIWLPELELRPFFFHKKLLNDKKDRIV